ncbi:MAG: NAD(+) diphosphatase [SAR202 cluster bacterium]|nr:NAD(+) diphosphatase [SAR202 cluster bacterium]
MRRGRAGRPPEVIEVQHVFSGNPFDRGEVERRDPKWIESTARQPGTRVLPLWKLNVLINRNSSASLGWLGPEILEARSPHAPAPILLGLMNGVAHYAVDVSDVEDPGKLGLPERHRFEEARAAAADVSASETGIIAQAKAQLDWHIRHRYCSVCGHESVPERGGLQRHCLNCNALHFPRTDPVVIMLVYIGDRCLLGQTRARASAGFYSCLAGFMDQGESIEEAVRREVREEGGVELKSVRYHSSQPWPFPSSLMIGCHAEAASDHLRFDAEEMTDVKWVSRSEALSALEGKHQTLKVPGPIAIAHHLIKAWATGQVA